MTILAMPKELRTECGKEGHATLYLIPVNISDAPLNTVLPQENAVVVASLRHFIVENVRTARRFLRKLLPDFPIDDCVFMELNVDTPPQDVWGMLEPLRRGYDIGLMSEAGCPAVADPGALAVACAQKEGLRVEPMVGPSSILMALMASGFNGQGFTFCGYLPVKQPERIRRIKELEATCSRTGFTQIFIETPYRNTTMLHDLCHALRPDTLICVASAITDPEKESIITLPASRWKGKVLEKEPTIFLLYTPR